MVTKDELRQFILSSLPTLSESLVDDKPLSEMGVDSLDQATLFFELEEKFELTVAEGDEGNLTTFDAICDYFDINV